MSKVVGPLRHRCHICATADCRIPLSDGKCPACEAWTSGRLDADARLHSRMGLRDDDGRPINSIRRWYRHVGIIGYSAERDYKAYEVWQYADPAPVDKALRWHCADCSERQTVQATADHPDLKTTVRLAPTMAPVGLDNDASDERVENWMRLVSKDGPIVYEHVVRGVSIRTLALEFGIPNTSLQRRIKAAMVEMLAAYPGPPELGQKVDKGGGGEAPPDPSDFLSSDDTAA